MAIDAPRSQYGGENSWPFISDGAPPAEANDNKEQTIEEKEALLHIFQADLLNPGISPITLSLLKDQIDQINAEIRTYHQSHRPSE